MNNTIEQLQVLYEIAMSIGLSLDLRLMLKTSLAVLLKKLSCSAGGVLFFQPRPISTLALNELQEIHFEEVFNIPRSIAHNKAYQAAIQRIPKSIPADRLDGFFQQLPLSGQEDPESYFYILELPDIGLLILTKYGEGLEPVILKSLKLLMSKLAGACKACLQNAALHESEARYRSLFEASADGILIVDFKTKTFSYANSALCRMLGYTEEELRTMGMADIHPKQDLQRVITEFEAQARGDKTLVLDIPCLSKDGRILYMDINSANITIDGRRNIMGIFRDITERKRVEEKLHESEQRYNALFERSLDLVYTFDFEGNIIDANDVALKLLGYKKEEIGSLNFASLLSEVQLPLAFKTTQEIRETGIQKDLVEFKLRCRNGEEVIVESTGSAIISNGVTVAIQSIARNITGRKRVEEKLKKLSSVVENATDHVFITDYDGVIEYVNPAFERITGYTKDDAIGKTPRILKSGKKTQEEYRQLWETIRAGKVFPVIMINRKKNGELYYEDKIITPLRDEQGNITHFVSTGRDITERMQAEKKIEIMARFPSENPNPVLRVERDGKINYANAASEPFLRLWNCTVGESLPPDWRDRVVIALSHSTITSVDLMCEKRFYSIMVVPIPIAGYVNLYGRDITEWKQAEEALRETTDYLDNLLSFANAPIMVWDSSNKITKFNLAFERLTGYTMYDVLGKNPEMLFSDDKREEISTLISRTADGENILSVELPVRCKDGSIHIVLWNTANIYTKDAKTITATIAIGQDITDRKQLEEGLRQMQKMEGLGTLAGGIAHDFNNILGIILAYITSTHRFKDDAKKLDLAVNTIVRAVERGKTIVQQILMFARKTETEFGAVNVNDIVMEMMTMIFETFPKNLTYAHNFDQGVSYINADRSQLHQVLLNLCVNARDAMPSGGILTINTRKVSAASLLHQHSNANASSYVRIEVVDTGEGMSDEIRKRIFEPFYTTKGIGKGTGLGLSVVFGIILNHKGFIDVESTLGKGTTFSIYLPAVQVAEPVGVKVEETLEEIPGGTETLLVVEDEEMLLMSLQMMLGEKGYKVLSAKDGLTAVNIYKERKMEIALVLTDLGLPKMSGMEECVQIKKLNPNARMIVATGFLDPGMKSEFLKVGVQQFLFKPYDLKQVLKVIRDVLDEK